MEAFFVVAAGIFYAVMLLTFLLYGSCLGNICSKGSIEMKLTTTKPKGLQTILCMLQNCVVFSVSLLKSQCVVM